MTVRTKELGNGVALATGATVVLYTVPAGRTAIVKGVSMGSTGASTGVLRANRGGVLRNIYSGVTTAAKLNVHEQVWIVLEAGDILEGVRPGGSGDITFWISGAELSGVAA